MMAAARRPRARCSARTSTSPRPTRARSSSTDGVVEAPGSAAHLTSASFLMFDEPCRLVQIIPTAFTVRMATALDDRALAVEAPARQEGDPAAAAALAALLEAAPVKLTAELGRSRIRVARAVRLPPGAIVELDREPDDPDRPLRQRPPRGHRPTRRHERGAAGRSGWSRSSRPRSHLTPTRKETSPPWPVFSSSTTPSSCAAWSRTPWPGRSRDRRRGRERRGGDRALPGAAPEVTTLDITMPELDGISALKAILEIDPAARVVMCSALGQESKVLESIKAGARTSSSSRSRRSGCSTRSGRRWARAPARRARVHYPLSPAGRGRDVRHPPRGCPSPPPPSRLAQRDLAVDLGTANTPVYERARGTWSRSPRSSRSTPPTARSTRSARGPPHDRMSLVGRWWGCSPPPVTTCDGSRDAWWAGRSMGRGGPGSFSHSGTRAGHPPSARYIEHLHQPRLSTPLAAHFTSPGSVPMGWQGWANWRRTRRATSPGDSKSSPGCGWSTAAGSCTSSP